jgi:signal transduction histidine kinase
MPRAVGFRDGLLEAILNLIDNAEHALASTGGVIRLKARHSDHSIRIEIEDDGPGISEALREQIFEPFFTTAATPGLPDQTGTGLGLAISGKLIADLGGTLSFEPVETGGARFVIEIPHGSAAAS